MAPKTYAIGNPFIELLTVDSTNNYAMAGAHAGMAQHGTTVFAHHQTRGKGQRHKQWLGQPGQNIAVSVIVEPQGLPLSSFFTFSMAMAVGVHRFFNNLSGEEASIKWPNDLYWRDRKAGGILIENSLQGAQWKFSVVGIGININQTDFDELATRAVSLKQISGRTYDTVALARELCTHLAWAFEKVHADSQAIKETYHQHLFKRGEKVTLKKGDTVFQTIIKGVNDQGELMTDAPGSPFAIGEVEWIF